MSSVCQVCHQIVKVFCQSITVHCQSVIMSFVSHCCCQSVIACCQSPTVVISLWRVSICIVQYLLTDTYFVNPLHFIFGKCDSPVCNILSYCLLEFKHVKILWNVPLPLNKSLVKFHMASINLNHLKNLKLFDATLFIYSTSIFKKGENAY